MNGGGSGILKKQSVFGAPLLAVLRRKVSSSSQPPEPSRSLFESRSNLINHPPHLNVDGLCCAASFSCEVSYEVLWSSQNRKFVSLAGLSDLFLYLWSNSIVFLKFERFAFKDLKLRARAGLFLIRSAEVAAVVAYAQAPEAEHFKRRTETVSVS